MKTRILACTVALLAASLSYANQPTQSVGTPGAGTPTQSIGNAGSTAGASTQNAVNAATPVRSIGTAGRGEGAGTGATPIEVVNSLTSASSTEPSIKMASTGSSVTIGEPVKVIATLPEGAAEPTVKEGTTPSSKGPAPKN